MQERTKLSAEGGPVPAHEWIAPSSACLSRAIAITLEKARLPFGSYHWENSWGVMADPRSFPKFVRFADR